MPIPVRPCCRSVALVAALVQAFGLCACGGPDPGSAPRGGAPPAAAERLAQRPASEPAADAPASTPDGAAAPAPGRTFVFDCDGEVSFTVRTGPGEVALWLPPSL